MPENTQEKHSKSAKKSLKNRVNPHGIGIMRFSLLEILFIAPLPMTVTEIELRLTELHGHVNKKWVRRVIGEMQQISGRGIAIQSTIKRVGDTRCPAYYILKPNQQ